MEQKLQKLYNECRNELKSIGIDIDNISQVGEIDISLSKRSVKRYGCCRQEDPDIKTKHITRRGRHIKICYDRYNKHHIEISRWVMELDETIIKNTIMHEMIHCLPGCNNHGTNFKNYASYINKKLGYEIKRLGDKAADYRYSNVEFTDDETRYRYKIECQNCKAIFYRQRLNKNFTRKYRCGKCSGKLKIL